jgi:hypothetical protein
MSLLQPEVRLRMPTYGYLDAILPPSDYLRANNIDLFADIGGLNDIGEEATNILTEPPTSTDNKDIFALCDECFISSVMSAKGSTLCTVCYYKKYGGLPPIDVANLVINQRVTVYNYVRDGVSYFAHATLVAKMPYGCIYKVGYTHKRINGLAKKSNAYIYINHLDSYFCEYMLKLMDDIIQRCKSDPNNYNIMVELNKRCQAFHMRLREKYNIIYRIINYSLPH